MTKRDRVTVIRDGKTITVPTGLFGHPLDGRTNDRMMAQIMRKGFDAVAFHKRSRRTHGVEEPRG
jgi:hypothetical protein